MQDDRPPIELAYCQDLAVKRGQAAVIGELWAERICRGDLRAREVWPEHEPKTLAIARRLVVNLGREPGLLDELAKARSAGAAAWWERRPMLYRIAPTSWHLETAPDERERCMYVGDGVRCERRTEWLIGRVAELACVYLCGVHLEFVRRRTASDARRARPAQDRVASSRMSEIEWSPNPHPLTAKLSFRQAIAEYSAQRYTERRAAGRCSECGAEATGYPCESHTEERRARRRSKA